MSDTKCPQCGGTNLKWAPHRAIGCADCGWEAEERSKNEPLTLDELRKMNGQPVWVANDGFWALVRVGHCGEVTMIANDGEVAYAKGWIKHVGPIYRRKLEVEK